MSDHSPTRFAGHSQKIISVCLLLGMLPSGLAVARSEPIRVDLGMATGRSDTATPGWSEWQVPNGPEATHSIAGVSLTLRAIGNDSELQGKWHKSGLATGATMATDGVGVTGNGNSDSLELEIAGLSPGRHTIATYHSGFSKTKTAALLISTAGSAQTETVTPGNFASQNDQAQNAFLEFQTTAQTPSVKIRVSANSGQVILNGIEIDCPNPKLKTRVPNPTDSDWHVDADDGTITLKWKQATDSKTHHVYLVAHADPERAEQIAYEATTDSECFLGSTVEHQYEAKVKPHTSLLHYCWRVDSVAQDGTTTRGDVWKFRVRQLAFPGAEGYGRFAIGGRGGRVLHVTNLDDSGPGSLRSALELDEPRTVVFDVSGRIITKSRLVVKNPFLTLAGHTAPGKGICISNYNLGLLGTHDCIVRHIRVRPGNKSGKTLDGMGMASSDHSIVDHCSISWTQDESFSSRGAKNITLQRTLISEALNVAGHKKYSKGSAHGFAASIGGDVGSFHHNLLAHCSGRNWSLAGGIDQATVHAGRLDIRNNLVYNWRTRTTDGGAKEVNFVNNFYRPGPATRVFHVLKPQHEMPFGPQQYYMLGNVMEGKYGADQRYAGLDESQSKPRAETIVDEPFFESFVETSSAADAVPDILNDVGCNRPVLDEHDKRVIEEVKNKTTTYQGSVTGFPGLPDSQEDVGGWEDYPEVHRPTDWDTDNDGLPNWWEQRENLNTNSPAGDPTEANADPDGDGYTNLEEYLHWMATPGNKVPE